jgi:hypothetical protein
VEQVGVREGPDRGDCRRRGDGRKPGVGPLEGPPLNIGQRVRVCPIEEGLRAAPADADPATTPAPAALLDVADTFEAVGSVAGMQT